MPRRRPGPSDPLRRPPRHGLPSPRLAAAIRTRLLRWYGAHRRRLPWRRRIDPYRVWVAETMLQQTQVVTVVPYYERFVSRFPDLASLAAAAEEEVLALWSGLGYYSRARRLHRAARLVVHRHGGRLPAERGALEALPGIGRYTAGAILSIAFGLEEPVVDGNVRRLLSRLLLADPTTGAAGSEASCWPQPPSRSLEEQARALLRGAPPAPMNQALMELGALVCRPAAPLCPSCPLARLCGARRLGAQELVPPPRRRPPAIRMGRAVAYIRDGERVLLELASGEGAPRGMWDLPGALVPPGADPRLSLERDLAARRLRVRVGREVAAVDHAITYRRIRTTAYEARLSEAPAGKAALRWVDRRRASAMPLAACARRLLSAACRSHSAARVDAR